MKKLKSYLLLCSVVLMLSATSIVFGQTPEPTPQPQTNSASSSPTPDTRADDAALRLACARTADELLALRPVAAAMKDENFLLTRLLTLERELRVATQDVRQMDAAEKDQLRKAVAAAEVTIDALKQANAVLKKNRWTVWKALKAAAVGTAVGVVAGVIIANR